MEDLTFFSGKEITSSRPGGVMPSMLTATVAVLLECHIPKQSLIVYLMEDLTRVGLVCPECEPGQRGGAVELSMVLGFVLK